MPFYQSRGNCLGKIWSVSIIIIPKRNGRSCINCNFSISSPCGPLALAEHLRSAGDSCYSCRGWTARRMICPKALSVFKLRFAGWGCAHIRNLVRIHPLAHGTTQVSHSSQHLKTLSSLLSTRLMGRGRTGKLELFSHFNRTVACYRILRDEHWYRTDKI